MGMSSSRRYGGQEITLTTTSTDSDWKVLYTGSSKLVSPSTVKWKVFGDVIHLQNSYEGYDTPTIDLSGNVGSKDIVLSTSAGLTMVYFTSKELVALDVSKAKSLNFLICDSNKLRELDVSKILKLFTLNCLYNPNLTTIYVNQNQLDKLNGVIPSNWNWEKDAHTKYVLKQ
ncbi:hypothetical protein [Tenacibaculum finnmarkense]|uniref:hypothetical protein n=1 Tax=Tenacibaculum finnmarkense TaxID=2781243 RepID=UPI001EFB714C|nr:hypothetical protein [Tenacibaculum finnmarkense]MCG8734014.1 hypothetical protein [Tenacibaculum finnmarkense]